MMGPLCVIRVPIILPACRLSPDFASDNYFHHAKIFDICDSKLLTPFCHYLFLTFGYGRLYFLK